MIQRPGKSNEVPEKSAKKFLGQFLSNISDTIITNTDATNAAVTMTTKQFFIF